jgi:hypothetical protein
MLNYFACFTQKVVAALVHDCNCPCCRFSGGGNGVYFACKNLHLCEVSAAFSLELEALPAQQQQQQQQQGQQQQGQQQQQARLKVSLSGISSSSSGQE